MDREIALDILASLGNDRRIAYNQDAYIAILKVMDYVDRLYEYGDKMKNGKNYLLSRLKTQETQEVRMYNLDSSGLVLNQNFLNPGGILSSPIVRPYGGDLLTLSPLSRSLPGRFSCNVLRGDDLEQTGINLSKIDTTLGPPPIRREINFTANQDLFNRIEQVQERIDHINCAIATKNASLRMMDAVAGSVLEDLASNVSLEADQRVGRARRRGEAGRPRGGPPRTRSPNKHDKTAMDKDNKMEITLPPQGIRTPSGRRESPTVPGALPSSSDAGPTLSSPTGGGLKVATVEDEMDPKDPLDLTFVACASVLEDESRVPPQLTSLPGVNEDLALTSTPSRNTRSSKRKSKKVSPDAITPSSEETAIAANRVPKIVLRKVKERSKKRMKSRTAESEEDTATTPEDTSSARMSADSDISEPVTRSKKRIAKAITEEKSDVEYTGTDYLDPEYSNKLRSGNNRVRQESTENIAESPSQDMSRRVHNRRQKKDFFRVWSAAEDGEDDDTEFCPEDLKIMGATAIGAIGIDCLKTTEFERKNSPNINGAISGIMKRKIRRAADVINTLVYKAETKGDPAFLRIRNRELEAEVEKLRLEEVLRTREMDDMKAIVADLKREVYELRGRLDDAEEDARKARESYRINRRVLL
ncbi:hypothetical protein RF55_5060 [Lasius niger]|uniref:Uncharacterized protein n=1 Tax=Lasius niger TaxID=67767 RepID=A0A0J7KWU8_LASNI|nr:hypothetical protein RF55_5060 [Lasius niger]